MSHPVAILELQEQADTLLPQQYSTPEEVLFGNRAATSHTATLVSVMMLNTKREVHVEVEQEC